jgi:hypothetical protein
MKISAIRRFPLIIGPLRLAGWIVPVSLLLLVSAAPVRAFDVVAPRNLPPASDPEKKPNPCPEENTDAENGCVMVTVGMGKTSLLADGRGVQLKVFETGASPPEPLPRCSRRKPCAWRWATPSCTRAMGAV